VPDPRLDELWQEVLAAWDDDRAHASFLEHCRATKQLGTGAARYRGQVTEGTGEGAEDAHRASARKRLGTFTMVAMLELDAAGTAPEIERLQAATKVVIWGGALLLLGITLFAAVWFLAL